MIHLSPSGIHFVSTVNQGYFLHSESVMMVGHRTSKPHSLAAQQSESFSQPSDHELGVLTTAPVNVVYHEQL